MYSLHMEKSPRTGHHSNPICVTASSKQNAETLTPFRIITLVNVIYSLYIILNIESLTKGESGSNGSYMSIAIV